MSKYDEYSNSWVYGNSKYIATNYQTKKPGNKIFWIICLVVFILLGLLVLSFLQDSQEIFSCVPVLFLWKVYNSFGKLVCKIWAKDKNDAQKFADITTHYGSVEIDRENFLVR